jgi:hypothetical protein
LNLSGNALADALSEEANTVNLKHLERRALSVGQCRNILKKIKEGERRYAEIEGEVESLREELGLGLKPISRQAIKARSVRQLSPQTTTTGKRKQNVGQRKARRDPIGIENNAPG